MKPKSFIIIMLVIIFSAAMGCLTGCSRPATQIQWDNIEYVLPYYCEEDTTRYNYNNSNNNLLKGKNWVER